MKALFLESKAAEECLKWAEFKQLDQEQTEELLNRAYENGRGAFVRRGGRGTYEDWWVGHCLDDDKHKKYGLISLFSWGRTEEGQKYWHDIYMRAM
jgi:hypothetical protein